MSEQQLPPYAVLFSHPVADWEAWKAGFDAHEGARVEASALGHHLNRGEDDPNMISIYLAVGDLDRMRAFAESDDLGEIMQELGVTGPPEVIWMTPARESVVWEGEHPAMVVRHHVADFDAWLEGYDAADEFRSSNGIIGHAASRSVDDPSLAVVYHQADSFDTLRAFLSDPTLKESMEAAGVTSEPEVSFHTAGWAKLY